jgi:hypothetical protein
VFCAGLPFGLISASLGVTAIRVRLKDVKPADRRTKEREGQNQRDRINELEMAVERNGERRKYTT